LSVTGDVAVYDGLDSAILAREPAAALDGARGSSARVAAGIAVYRNNSRAAYLRALEDAFPAVRRLVGDEFFRFLARAYFHARAHSSPLVARYGDWLPAFLATFEPVAGLPYLPDVARLEVAWLEAYHAADAPTLAREEIFAALAQTPERARIVLHPSTRLLASDYPVHTIWLHNRQERDQPLKLESSGERVLVVRPDAEVVTAVASAGLSAALKAVSAGASLGEAMNEAAAAAPQESPVDIIGALVRSGAISSIAT
jgi:hypothetical protein